MDIVDKSTRSRIMSSVRSKNTTAEIDIRHRIYQLGYRYRLHKRDLPGRPDLVFSHYRAIVFINGCFWHNHECRFGALPKTRRVWWRNKLRRNRRRDIEVSGKLRKAGWRVMTVWECSYRFARARREQALDAVATRVVRFLRSRTKELEISGQVITTIREKRTGD